MMRRTRIILGLTLFWGLLPPLWLTGHPRDKVSSFHAVPEPEDFFPRFQGNGSVPPACPWDRVLTGADQPGLYLPLLQGKRVGVVANHTSVVRRACLEGTAENLPGNREALFRPLPGTADTGFYVHLVDFLLDSGIQVRKVFSPEHGFRGQAEAGASVGSQTDAETGLPLVSLYGKHKKPTSQDLQDVDILLFDLQDVGLRFYTYISTLHYVLEACAEAGIPVVVLDRPNPHAGYVDGPVLDTVCCRSFVGMHPVPVVYGMTIGEYARMIQGEHWLQGGIETSLEVVPLLNYTRQTEYVFPVAPSPNLRSMKAIYAYPSLCFFEGTPVSLGRGTWHPFECFGFPASPEGDYRFTPGPIPGLSENPPCKGVECTGFRISDTILHQLPRQIDLGYLQEMYRVYPDKSRFFTAFFSKLSGTPGLEDDLEAGRTEAEIRSGWQPALEEFLEIREKYLIYR